MYASDYPYGRLPNSLLLSVRTAKLASFDDRQLRSMLGENAQRIADSEPPLPLTAPRGGTSLVQPLTFARIHHYISMAVPMLWLRQRDGVGALGLAVNASRERDGHRDEAVRIEGSLHGTRAVGGQRGDRLRRRADRADADRHPAREPRRPDRGRRARRLRQCRGVVSVSSRPTMPGSPLRSPGPREPEGADRFGTKSWPTPRRPLVLHVSPVSTSPRSFVTIDPPESRDLDQALHLERRGKGYRVRYAIADVAAFVTPGGPMDQEAHARGQTLYAPDYKARLYPPRLSEDAGSLLPGQIRPALVWDMEVDETGEGIEVSVSRALVRSRVQLDYAGAQRSLDDGTAEEPLRSCARSGRCARSAKHAAEASRCRSRAGVFRDASGYALAIRLRFRSRAGTPRSR